ncbi:MAG TPA: hypothetical protein VK919_12805 [Solirubrobacterales bacterium]|nr:hypothetical protein [Solirubrobacterales bacterium]
MRFSRTRLTVEQLEPETSAWFAERYGDDVVVDEGPLFVPE